MQGFSGQRFFPGGDTLDVNIDATAYVELEPNLPQITVEHINLWSSMHNPVSELPPCPTS